VKRRIAYLIVALSLLFFAATLAAWACSYRRADMLIHAQPGRQTALSSHRGRAIFESMGDDAVTIRSALLGWRQWQHDTDDPSVPFVDHPALRAHHFLGFAYANVGSVGMPTRRMTALAIPYWSFALLLLITPALALHRARRRQWRQRHRHCLACGYDLRASADRCPECGAAIPTSAGISGSTSETVISHEALPHPDQK